MNLKENANLRNENASFLNYLKMKELELERISNEFSNKTQENQILKKQIDCEKEDKKNMRNELTQSYARDLETLKHQLEEFRQSFFQNEASLDRKEREILAKKQKIKELLQENEDLTIDLKNERILRRNERDWFENELSLLKEKTLGGQLLEQTIEEIPRSRNEETEDYSILAENNEKIEQLNQSLIKERMEKLKYQELFNEKHSEEIEKSMEMEKIQGKINKNEIEIKDKNDEIMKLKEIIKDFNKEINKKNEVIVEFEKKTTNNQKEKDNIENELNRLNQEKMKSEQIFQEKMENLEKTCFLQEKMLKDNENKFNENQQKEEFLIHQNKEDNENIRKINEKLKEKEEFISKNSKEILSNKLIFDLKAELGFYKNHKASMIKALEILMNYLIKSLNSLEKTYINKINSLDNKIAKLESIVKASSLFIKGNSEKKEKEFEGLFAQELNKKKFEWIIQGKLKENEDIWKKAIEKQWIIVFRWFEICSEMMKNVKFLIVKNHKENVHQITIRTCLEDIEKFLIILNKEALKRVKICTNTKDFEKNFIDIFEFNERFSNELNEKKGK